MTNDISSEKARNAILSTSSEHEDNKEANIEKLKSNEALVHLDGLRLFYKLRKKWSWAIFSFIAASIIFQFSITVFVGVGWLNFEKYPWFLPLVIFENFIQIIGLAIIVVKFLFSEQKLNDH